MKIARLPYLLLMLFTCGSAVAQKPTTATLDVRSLLVGNDFAILDEHFNALQRDYVAGRRSEVELRDAFRVFYDTAEYLEPAYSKWVAKYPNSYVAHLARGIYYRYLGNHRRGDAFAADTSAAQFKAMRDAHKLAMDELEISIKLDSKPLLSFHNLIDIRSTAGDHAGARQNLERGLKIAPRSFILREKYLGTLRTKWGGSTEQMRAFIEEVRPVGFTQQQMAQLNSHVLNDEAWVREFHQQDSKGAIALYRQAALLSPATACSKCGPEYRRAALLMSEKKYAEAIEIASRVLTKEPDNIPFFNLRGTCYQKLKKGPEAVADYLHGVRKSNPEALTQLAKMLMAAELVPEDRDRAVRYLERAAALHYAEAEELLPNALNYSLKFRYSD